MAAGPLVNNVIAPWAYGIYSMFNPGAQNADKGDYPYNDYPVSPSPALNIPSWLTSGQQPPSSGGQQVMPAPSSLTTTLGTRPRSATGGNPYYESWIAGESSIPAPNARVPMPVRPPGGTPTPSPTPSPTPTPAPAPGGGGGPTGSPYAPGPTGSGSGDLSMQDWFRMYQNGVLNRQFQAPQSPEEQAARSWSINEFANADKRFDNWFGNYAPQPGETPEQFAQRSTWARARQYQNQNLGAFDAQGRYVGGQNGPLYSELKNLIALQGLSPYADPQSWGGAMIPINRQAVSDANVVTQLAPTEADKALTGVVGDRRNAFTGPGAATGGFLSTISPLNQIFSSQVGSPDSWVSGINSALQPMADERGQDANLAYRTMRDAGFDLAGQRNALGYDPMAIANQGVTDTRALGNGYEDSLMRAIDAESRRSLAQQTPEVAAQMAAAGYGDSGAGQAAMGNLQSAILEQANRDKIRALSDLRQQSMAQQAQAISQRTGIGADDANSVLGLAGQLYGQGFGAREDARNQIYNTLSGGAQQAYMGGRGAAQDMLSQQYGTTVGGAANLYGNQLGAQNDMENSIFNTRAGHIGGMQQSAWNARNDTLARTYDATRQAIMGGLDADSRRRMQDMQLLNSGLFGSEDAQMRRAMSQLGMNQAGLDMGMNLFNAGNQNEMNYMNLMMGLGRSNQDYNQQYLDQAARLMLMPYQTGLQMTTGINTSPVPNNYRVDPWSRMGAQVGGQVLGNVLGGGGGGGGSNLFAAGDWTEG